MRLQIFSLALFATILFAGACTTAPQPPATTAPIAAASSAPKMAKADIEKALFQIEKDGTIAMVKNDASFIERVMADDWMWTMSNGIMVGRSDLLSDVKAGNFKFEDASMSELHATVYGDTAIVMGKQMVKGKYKGQDISGTEAFTDTFVNLNGQWRCVATHNSPVMKK